MFVAQEDLAEHFATNHNTIAQSTFGPVAVHLQKNELPYFSKNYFTNFAKYMKSLLLDIASESSKFVYEIRMTPLLFAV